MQTATAQYNRGTALVRGRDYPGAKAAFEAALQLDPGNGRQGEPDVTEPHHRLADRSAARTSDTEEGRSRPTTPSRT